MTLAEQFPDISMFIREKNKLNLKYDSALFLKDIRYSAISTDQKFYDREFKIFHYKLLTFIVVLLAGLFVFILNGQSIWKWLVG